MKNSRGRTFIKLIWSDIGLAPKEIMVGLVAGGLAAAIIMAPILGLAYFLAWITEQPFEAGAILASIAIWFMLIAAVLLVGYLKNKWREAE